MKHFSGSIPCVKLADMVVNRQYRQMLADMGFDSFESVYKRDQAQTQKAKDAEAMRDVKSEQVETKAKAKEAERIEGEAQDAAKQSKNELKTEKKAQKLRKQADKQAEKAEQARDKSDLN